MAADVVRHADAIVANLTRKFQNTSAPFVRRLFAKIPGRIEAGNLQPRQRVSGG